MLLAAGVTSSLGRPEAVAGRRAAGPPGRRAAGPERAPARRFPQDVRRGHPGRGTEATCRIGQPWPIAGPSGSDCAFC